MGLFLDLAMVGGGLVAGVALNDLWEINQWPGYGVIVFPIIPDADPTKAINVGWDDIYQTLVGLGVMVAGKFIQDIADEGAGKSVFELGLGMTAAVPATKVAERYPINDAILGGSRSALQIIPHIPGQVAGAVFQTASLVHDTPVGGGVQAMKTSIGLLSVNVV